MKQAVLVVNGPRGGHQHSWCGAFAEGLRKHGWKTHLSHAAEPADMVVFWSARRRQQIDAQLAVGEVCILERGYLGDRFAWTSVSFGGGLNGRAEFRGTSADPARFERHHGHLLKPWKAEENGLALVMGQVPGDMALAPVRGRLEGWYRDVCTRLKRLGYDVRFRPHPQAPEGTPVPEGVKMSVAKTLRDALAGAGLVVTFNSNSAVDAVLAGTPAVATDIGSMAWPVTTHRIDETPIRPDRAEWAAELAWKQWSEAEIRSGECWAAIVAGEPPTP